MKSTRIYERFSALMSQELKGMPDITSLKIKELLLTALTEVEIEDKIEITKKIVELENKMEKINN